MITDGCDIGMDRQDLLEVKHSAVRDFQGKQAELMVWSPDTRNFLWTYFLWISGMTIQCILP